jgi:anti-sigma regulatory factor (Ser/Thr protein kinase)
MNSKFKLEIKLPKVPEIELVAIEGLERMGKHLGIPDDKIGEARVVVTEAIINALEYTEDANPSVKVEFEMTKEKLIILVADSGKGFNPDEVDEPDIKKKLEDRNKRGWGIKLMKSMSDDLIIESKPTGTKISIIKHLS